MNMTVISELERNHIPYELLPHRRTTTAKAEASALHVPADEVAKTIVLGTTLGYVRVLVPATERVDPRKVAAAVGAGEVRLVPESELVGAYPEFELGATPPVAGPSHDRVLVDESFRTKPSIVFEAGRHTESVRVRTGDLLSATHAVVADLVLD